MEIQHPQRYFWTKYFLAVILLSLLVVLSLASDIRIGIVIFLFLGARTIVGPFHMYYLTKKGKFNDGQYLKMRNKQNVIIGIGVIAAVVVIFVILLYDWFEVGVLTLPLLSILTVFIAIDVGNDIWIFLRLNKKNKS